MSEIQDNNHTWICGCGQKNDGKFCIVCGQARPQIISLSASETQTETGNSWICNCGQRNEGKFCMICGQPRDKDSESTIVEKPNTTTPNPESTLKSKPPTKTIKKSLHVNPRVLIILSTIIILALGITGGILAKYYFGVEATSTDISFTGKTKDKGSLLSTEFWANAESDLSLEGVELGTKLEKVHELLGTETQITKKVGGQLYSFADLDVFLKNGVTIELISTTPDARTKRGIHQGSVEDEVLQTYGQEYQKVSLIDGTAYDYTLKTSDDKTGTLRFIMNNGKVKTIRIWLNTPINNTTSANTSANAAIKVMQNYHQAITNRQYQQAYSMLTKREQNQMGIYDNFAKGFDKTIYSSVTDLKIVSASPNRVVLNYKLTAKDRAEGGKVMVQTFAGTATLILQGNTWLIDEKSSKKTGTRIE